MPAGVAGGSQDRTGTVAMSLWPYPVPHPHPAPLAHSFSLPGSGPVFNAQLGALPTAHTTDQEHRQAVPAAAAGRPARGPQVSSAPSPPSGPREEWPPHRVAVSRVAVHPGGSPLPSPLQGVSLLMQMVQTSPSARGGPRLLLSRLCCVTSSQSLILSGCSRVTVGVGGGGRSSLLQEFVAGKKKLLSDPSRKDGGKVFVKRPDPHEEALMILKGQMSHPAAASGSQVGGTSGLGPNRIEDKAGR